MRKPEHDQVSGLSMITKENHFKSENDRELILKTYQSTDIKKAREYLAMLCVCEKPCMSIPPHPLDWDMVFCRVITRLEKLEGIVEEHARYKEVIQTIICDREVLNRGEIYDIALKAWKGQNDE